jgi:hypothetical protein
LSKNRTAPTEAAEQLELMSFSSLSLALKAKEGVNSLLCSIIEEKETPRRKREESF